MVIGIPCSVKGNEFINLDIIEKCGDLIMHKGHKNRP